MSIESYEFTWTDGSNSDFRKFYLKTEEYYSKIVGGEKNRIGFIPYNLSESISDVLIAYADDKAVGCAGLKKYSDQDVEIKRVWVEPEWRGKHIATQLMDQIEDKEQSFKPDRSCLMLLVYMKAEDTFLSKITLHTINWKVPFAWH